MVGAEMLGIFKWGWVTTQFAEWEIARILAKENATATTHRLLIRLILALVGVLLIVLHELVVAVLFLVLERLVQFDRLCVVAGLDRLFHLAHRVDQFGHRGLVVGQGLGPVGFGKL